MRKLTFKFDANSAKDDVFVTLYTKCNDEKTELGTINGGEEKILEIEEAETKLFASVGEAEESYSLPEGNDDITLIGKYDEDGLFSIEKEEQPKKKSRLLKGVLLFLGALVAGVVIGYLSTSLIIGGMSKKEKVFMISGMSITLNGSFEQQVTTEYDGYIASKDVAVFINKDEIGSIMSGRDTEEYAKNAVAKNNIQTEIKTENGVSSFVFTAVGENGKTFCYYAYVYKTDDAFWLIQFAVGDGKAKKYSSQIDGWAGSIKFH